MANLVQVLRLKWRGVASWNKWRRNRNNRDIQIDLSEANFIKANFTGANLSDADFTGADLRKADLRKADLRKADLRKADLTGANLRFAELRGADLTGANLNVSDLTGAKFNGAYLNSANFQNQILRKADLTGANLTGAKFNGADLTGANLTGANLTGADLTDAKLNDAKLNGANLTDAKLTDAKLNGADLTSAKLYRTQALGTYFTGAILTEACIENWNIDNKINLENVICDYIYLSRDQRKRSPSDPNRNFQPREFVKLVEKYIETVDLIFKDGIDWRAFLTSFQILQVEYGEQNVSIQAIEKKSDGALVIRLNVPSDVDKAEIERRAKESYKTNLKLLETQYRDELQAKGREIKIYKRPCDSEWTKNNAGRIN